MRIKIPRIFPKHPLYIQLFFTGFAFVLMILLSYFFVNRIVRDNLVRNTDSVLDFVQAQIETDIAEMRATLSSFSQTVRSMVINGESSDKIMNYTNNISIFLSSMEKSRLSINGVYAYIEKFPGGPAFFSDFNTLLPDDYSPPDRPWYKAAIAANGEIAETKPYLDVVTNELVITYSCNIYDDKGVYLGVTCIDVYINYIGEKVIDTLHEKNGYGFLAAQDLTLLSHSNPDFLGMKISDPEIPFSVLSDKLLEKGAISETPLVNWKGERTIYFARKLPNGWYLGFFAIRSVYYQKVRYMAVTLSALGIALATVLIMVLIKLDTARNKSDIESRHKSAFLANMSHEIRTPMNAIIGMVTIGKTAPDIERKDYCFDKIEEASHHLLGIINDILDMSKIEANKFDLSPVEFNFEKMLQEVVNIINFRINEKKQKFFVHVDKNIPKMLIGDDQRLAQVLTNLLSNAIKFTPEKGSITLNTRFLKEENGICTLQISVSDTGIGISQEQQAKLFQSFEQAESNTTRKYGGTGLGLAICKSIVEMMNGEIWIDSEVGKGSTFVFNIQIKRSVETTGKNMSADKQQEEKVQENIAGIFAGHRILLVEDVDINREIVQTLLEPTQLQIDCAENGVEAVRMFKATPYKYDLIFMDIQMPEMDGYEATRQIRTFEKEQNADAKGVPIIAMTANVFNEDIERCAKAGMNSHVGKPIDINEVMLKLKTYLT
ncbi:hybrid sensor histidine kinase/response regulator [Treponema sp. R6D11]